MNRESLSPENEYIAGRFERRVQTDAAEESRFEVGLAVRCEGDETGMQFVDQLLYHGFRVSVLEAVGSTESPFASAASTNF